MRSIAKLANSIAKDTRELEGLCDLTDPATRARFYRGLPAGDVGGIGGQTVAKLEAAGIRTIADFVAMDARMARDMLTVVGGRIQAELKGVSCLRLSSMAATRKGVAVTRSFGRPITS